ISVPDVLRIDLTDAEDKLCGLLNECAADLKGNGISTSCRIAGGWVRDKVRIT
ncbi:hypothetical protein CYLTODRAFT_321889, partial [Cylindrobasidium torrendii FP15055 ss-10]